MIKLINNYYIAADSYQYILRKKVTRTKESDNTTYEDDVTVGYYRDIPILIKYCLSSIIRDEIIANEIDTLSQLADRIQSIYDELNAMLNPLDIMKLSETITK